MPRRRRPIPIAATSDLFVARSPLHGLGVFAARPFAPGDLVERCPLVVCPDGQEAHLAETNLHGLYFTWGDGVAVALGFGSLYNHSWTPNAEYEPDERNEVMRILCHRPIAEGDEVTLNYLGHPDERGELWFELEPPPD